MMETVTNIVIEFGTLSIVVGVFVIICLGLFGAVRGS